MGKRRHLTEDKQKLGVAIVLAVFAIIAILGYSLDQSKEPVRVAFNTKGGGVIFDHQMHASLENTGCQECHHNYTPGEDKDKPAVEDMKCRSCHYSKDSEFAEICQDAAVHKRCIGKNCINCHAKGSVDCTFCHNAENFKLIQAPKTVQFETENGPVTFNHLTHASPDDFDIACDTCHHGYKAGDKETKAFPGYPMNCRRCHYNTKYETICESDDVHSRCIGKNCIDCHTDGADDCEICHKG